MIVQLLIPYVLDKNNICINILLVYLFKTYLDSCVLYDICVSLMYNMIYFSPDMTEEEEFGSDQTGSGSGSASMSGSGTVLEF